MISRQAKIIATLGPATDNYTSLLRLLKAGVDVVRLNLSHGDNKQLEMRVGMVKQISRELQRPIGIMFDLQGPKIRIANFENEEINLECGDEFTLIIGMSKPGNKKCVGVTYSRLANDCKKGDMLLLDDGRITMQVIKISVNKVICRVVNGGVLQNRKGLNKKGGGLSANSITAKDKADIKKIVQLGADYIAVSFVRSADDIKLARRLIKKSGGDAGIIAKIETAESVRSYEGLLAIVKESDGAMMARGDLGVEVGETRLIGMQKDLITMCRANDRIAITATQMMETMIENPLPTRAEVFDVANAVLDGTDAVMLSAETASGKHPHLVVETMSKICTGADSYHQRFNILAAKPSQSSKIEQINRAIAVAAVRTAHSIDKVMALVSLTESGSTALYMSRINTSIPIYGLSSHQKTLRKMMLYRDLVPLYFEQPSEQVGMAVLNFMQHHKFIKKGERMILTSGMNRLVSGSTNTMRILEA